MTHIGQIKNNELNFETNFKNSFIKSFDKSDDYSQTSDFLTVFQQSLSSLNYAKPTETNENIRPESSINYSYELKNLDNSSIAGKLENNTSDKKVKDEEKIEEKNSGKKEFKTEATSENLKNIKENIFKDKKSITLDSARQEFLKTGHQVAVPEKTRPEILNGKEVIAGIKKGIENNAIKKTGEGVITQAKTAIQTAEVSPENKVDGKKTNLFSLFNERKSAQNSEANKNLTANELQNNKENIRVSNKQQIKKDHNLEKAAPDLQKSMEVNVSRETIASAKETEKTNETSNNKNFSFKTETFEKPVGMAGLKSEMNSDLSSNQNQNGFSLNNAEKITAFGKSEDSSIIRQNLQEQIDQLLQKAKIVIKDSGNARLSTKLNPKELGEISIKLVLSGGKLTGKFTVESDIVQKELNDKLNILFNELKSDGYEIDGFQVDVKSQNADEGNSDNRFLNIVKNEFDKSFFSGSNREILTSEYNMEKNIGGIYA